MQPTPGEDVRRLTDAEGGSATGACDNVRIPVSSLDERTPLGLTGGEFVAEISGERQATITWESRGELIVAPGPTTSRLTLNIVPQGMPRYALRTEPDPAGLNSGCSGSMEVDATATARTEDGGLDESWAVVLVAKGAGARPGGVRATFTVDLAKMPVRGTFRATSGRDAAPDERSCLYGVVSNGGTDGRIDVEGSCCPDMPQNRLETRAAFWVGR